jgi:hypothetical protein
MIPLLLLLSHSRTILGLLSLIGRWWLLLLHRLCYEIVKAWNTENETRAMIHYLIPLDPFIHVAFVAPPSPHHPKNKNFVFLKLCSLKLCKVIYFYDLDKGVYKALWREKMLVMFDNFSIDSEMAGKCKHILATRFQLCFFTQNSNARTVVSLLRQLL